MSSHSEVFPGQGPPTLLPPPLARLRNRIRSFFDASFRYELLWALGGSVALAVILSSSPLGVHYGDLPVGQPAPRDIVVAMDVEIPDQVRTAAMRESARRQVPPVYVFDSRAGERAAGAIAEAFQAGRDFFADFVPSGTERAPLPPSLEPPLREAVMTSLPPGISHEFVQACGRTGFSPRLERALKSAIQSILSEMVVLRRDQISPDRPIAVRVLGEGRETLFQDLSHVADLDAARQAASEAAAALPDLADSGRKAAADALEKMVVPTLTHDPEETARRMDEAARRVPALFARIERGSVLARKGEPLAPDVVEQAHAVERAQPWMLQAPAMIGTALLAALLFGFLWRYPRATHRRGGGAPKHLFSKLVLLVVVMLAISRVLMAISFLLVERLDPPFNRLEMMMFLMPAAAGGMLATLLFSGRAAMVYSIYFSLPYAILGGWDLRLLAFSLITHFAAIYGAAQYRARTAPLKAGFVVGVVGAVAAIALDLASAGATGPKIVAVDAAAALAGGAIGASLLVSFLLPIGESLFGVLTDVRLLELSNLNNPLLSQLAASAPGSYNHSLIVGTLAEAAAEAIGANGLFCRVAAFYHDIGKMKMPEYYIENQRANANPHDRLVPNMSVLVIANHVKEGARLARDHGLPQQIVEVIPQHHGTRVMTYFYEKAKTAAGANADTVKPDDFRYPGPKPQTREAAIFMLADSVEAAARTIDQPDAEKFRAMIRQIAGRIVLDGQFDECDLTFRDLDAIFDSFVRSLVAIYHHRVDYPTYVFEAERRERKPSRSRAVTPRSREDAATGRPEDAEPEGDDDRTDSEGTREAH